MARLYIYKCCVCGECYDAREDPTNDGRIPMTIYADGIPYFYCAACRNTIYQDAVVGRTLHAINEHLYEDIYAEAERRTAAYDNPV